MKKFLVVLFILILATTVVNAATFEDTVNMNCEYAVDRLSYLNIINGTTSSTYNPEKLVTRAELSKMIINVIGDNGGTISKTFTDIEGNWGKEYILKIASLGYLNGYSDGTFKPDNSVSYAEAIAIILRCMGYTNLNENSGNTWYSVYINEMNRIGLNDGIDNILPENPANRGDIAILVWNMISSNQRANSNVSLLEERFGNYRFIDKAKVTDISTDGANIVYVTDKGKFTLKDNIDFSDLGGELSGFLDNSTGVLVGAQVDADKNYEKISGSAEALSKYTPFSATNLYGYGEKAYAEYVEIFVDKDTNKVARVVYYDTSESHFAEEIKISSSKVSIESRDVFEHSVVYLDNGEKITYNYLKTESVKDINRNALLVYDGKVIDWTEVPDNSVIREIKEDLIYTFVHKFVDGVVEKTSVTLSSLTIDGVEYNVSEDCICQNTKTQDTMTFKEGLSRSDITEITKNQGAIRIYLNEYNEIVKFEFEYNIWGENELKEEGQDNENIEKELNKFGFVTNISFRAGKDGNENNDREIVKYLGLPSAKSRSEETREGEFEVGDFVYFRSGEELIKVNDTMEFDNFEFKANYLYPIVNGKIGDYTFNEMSQIVEVLLYPNAKNNGSYSRCELREVKTEEMANYLRYSNIYVFANVNKEVVRLYALKEIGNNNDYGIIKKIDETISGDELISTKLYIINNKNSSTGYDTNPVMGFDVGDLVTYELENDKINIIEVYRHELIGNSKDLIVDTYSKDSISFKNSNLVIDLNSNVFEFEGTKYNFEDLIIINATVSKDSETGEWHFKNWNIKEKDKLDINKASRFAINELSGTIVVYNGYTE